MKDELMQGLYAVYYLCVVFCVVGPLINLWVTHGIKLYERRRGGDKKIIQFKNLKRRRGGDKKIIQFKNLKRRRVN